MGYMEKTKTSILKSLRKEKRAWKKDCHSPSVKKAIFKLKTEELSVINVSQKYGKVGYRTEDVISFLKNKKENIQEKLKI